MRVLNCGVAALCLSAAFVQAQSVPKKTISVDLVSSVDPTIGGIGKLLTSTPALIQLPHGMARVMPATDPGMLDWYVSDDFYGLNIGPVVVLPVSEKTRRTVLGPVASRDHDREIVAPDYYSLISDVEGTRIEATTARKSLVLRLGFPESGLRKVSFALSAGATLRASGDSGLVEVGKAEGDAFAVFHLSEPVSSLQCADAAAVKARGKICEVTLAAESKKPVEIRVGVSYLGAEQAEANLREELTGKTFEQIRAASRATWNTALGRIRIEGGTTEQRRIFYTSLYRSLLRMMNITEGDRYYSGFDHRVHEAEGHPFYVDDGMWDTYRSLHPLQLLLEPKVEQDEIRSYLRMYQQSGWLPMFPAVTGERAVMLGNHTASMIADAYVKGYRDFDAEVGLRASMKNALEGTHLPWTRGEATDLDRFYQKSGYFPALAKGEKETEPRVHPHERRQASSVTLENAYDDWCIAQLAKALGHEDVSQQFLKRAGNYALLFNPATGFIEAKSQNGKWIEDFDPKLGGGQGGRAYFAEVNSYVDTFHVQHDPAGLMKLMGGREKFVARLDGLFQEPLGTSRWTFLGQFPDMTGLLGMYPQGNEPAFHIPYLYIAAGQPWKTQRRVRQIMDAKYTDRPEGIPGDEDTGAMSSWYVFSALGFYPMCPGSPVYEIGSPLFARSVVSVGDGKKLTIVAHGVSAAKKYIQSATLNGKPLTRAWFWHREIAQGGTLVLEMGAVPNMSWGVSEAPPSMSSVD
jgi:predicted alpha-1,2-mannosidase